MSVAPRLRGKTLRALQRFGVLGRLIQTTLDIEPITQAENRTDTAVSAWMVRDSRNQSVRTDQGFEVVETSTITVFWADVNGAPLDPAPSAGDRIEYEAEEFTVTAVAPQEVAGQVIVYQCSVGRA